MTKISFLAAALALALCSPAPTAAQRGPTLGSVAGAVLGGTVGLLGGGLAGGAITSNDCEPGNPDQCLGEAMPGFIWGAGVGMTLGIPLGTHVGNGRRGDLARSLLVSAALFGAEVLVLNRLVDDGRTQHMEAVRGVAIAVPIVQIVSSIWIESATDGR